MRNVHTALRFFFATAVTVAAFAPLARASSISLLDQVEVRGNSIFLSDLLPPQVPAAMRTSTQRILIGVAPQPGSARVLDGSKIAGLIGGADSARDIDIPQRIIVRRSGRRITREEVVAAIHNSLVRSGLPDTALQPDDLRVFPDVMASSNDAPLQVRRIDFDETLNQAKFLMAERGALPFLVTAQFRETSLVEAATREPAPVDLPQTSDGSRQADAKRAAPPVEFAPSARDDAPAMLHLASGSLVNVHEFAGPTLVEAGKPATLFLNSGTMQMLLDVTALERGSLNQTIRVRLPGTGKVLRAQVTGSRRLEAAF